MPRTMTVTGRGKISVPPDQIQINMVLSEIKPTYQEAMDAMSNSINILGDCIESIGFSREDLKTKRFDVQTEYENYKEGDEWKKRFVGYKVTNELKLEFDADTELLSKVLGTLSSCSVNPEFSIQFKIKDIEQVKNLLLSKAIEDSREKAEVLAKASGVKLREILNINYSWQDINIYSQPILYNAKLSSEDSGYVPSIGINPEDIEITDTVTVVWEIH